MIRKMLIAATALVFLAAAPATAQYNDFTVTPGTVNPGGQVTVTGRGCSPGAQITIILTPRFGARPVGTIIGYGTADDDGNFTVDVTIPDGTAPGSYAVSAMCDETEVGSVNIEVLGTSTPTTPTTPTHPGGGDANPIVRTGSDLNGIGLVGAGLLAVGGLVLMAGKRRTAKA